MPREAHLVLRQHQNIEASVRSGQALRVVPYKQAKQEFEMLLSVDTADC